MSNHDKDDDFRARVGGIIAAAASALILGRENVQKIAAAGNGRHMIPASFTSDHVSTLGRAVGLGIRVLLQSSGVELRKEDLATLTISLTGEFVHAATTELPQSVVEIQTVILREFCKDLADDDDPAESPIHAPASATIN